MWMDPYMHIFKPLYKNPITQLAQIRDTIWSFNCQLPSNVSQIYNITLQFYQHAHSHIMPIINEIPKANKFVKLSITLTIFEFQLPSIFFSLSAANRLPSHTSINAKIYTERWTHTRGWGWRWICTERQREGDTQSSNKEREWRCMGFQFFIFKTFSLEGFSCPCITPFRYGPKMGHKNSFLII